MSTNSEKRKGTPPPHNIHFHAMNSHTTYLSSWTGKAARGPVAGGSTNRGSLGASEEKGLRPFGVAGGTEARPAVINQSATAITP